MSKLGLRFVLDTNLIDDTSGEMAELRRLHTEGWIELTRTDVMDTELSKRQDPKHRAELLTLSGELVEHQGVMVWGHSRWGASRWAGGDDRETWERVWDVLWPGRDRQDPASEHHVRDAMHVWTAMLYGANALVTLDGSGKKPGLLDRAQAVREAFDDFAIVPPRDALAFAQRMLTRYEHRTQAEVAEPTAED